MKERAPEQIEADRPRRSADARLLDTELADLPPELRWREWMGRVEAVIFASSQPVNRETLALVVGRSCSIDLIIDDIRAELKGRPYELVAVAGGWQHRTRKMFGDVIRCAFDGVSGQGANGARPGPKPLSEFEGIVLICIAYYQPITRAELGAIFGREVSRDTMAALRNNGFVASGPRSPQPGAPYTYVTTQAFLSEFGLSTLRDLPDAEALEDAGLLSKERLMAGELLAGSEQEFQGR